MREERGQIAGDVIVFEPFTLWGNIGGDVNVIERGKLYIRGAVYGDVVVEYGGRMHVFGRITGTLTVHRGAKVIHSGVLGGDLVNQGGRVYIDHIAKIMGKVKTEKGETTVQQAPRVPK
jgi:cytoskeletal protein CcmA (bactofilin family)